MPGQRWVDYGLCSRDRSTTRQRYFATSMFARDDLPTGMPLPGVSGLRLATPAVDSPIATVPAFRESDGAQLRLTLVTAQLAPGAARRIRSECAALEGHLTSLDPSLVLPVLDHGVDAEGRPYLVTAQPGPALSDLLAAEGSLPVPAVLAAAATIGAGLQALAAKGIVGPPPELFQAAEHAIVMGTPLPPALVELAAAQGRGSGHEPPEILAGQPWSPRAQTYACASMLWTLASGQHPFSGTSLGEASTLARLTATQAPQMSRPGVPDATVALLRQALSTDPASRPASPADLAHALRDTAAHPLGSLYLLDTEIGRGAAGRVWAGRRRRDGAPIAAKVLRAEFVEDEAALGRFVREFTVQRSLNHPNLVRIHDFIKEGGIYAIVMELVEGGNLRGLLRRGRPPLAQAAHILSQTAQGIAVLHHAGLIHRDVKPENVLIAGGPGGPHAKVTDFGIARAVEGSSATQMIGTPYYLAPEVILDRPPTPACDIYALGITAYELVAGHLPFHGANAPAVMEAHVSQHAARPAGLPDSLWHLIADCLRKEPHERPTADEVAGGWAAVASGQSAPHWPPARDARPPSGTRPPGLHTATEGPLPSPAHPAAESPPPSHLSAAPHDSWPPDEIFSLLTGAGDRPPARAAKPRGEAAPDARAANRAPDSPWRADAPGAAAPVSHGAAAGDARQRGGGEGAQAESGPRVVPSPIVGAAGQGVWTPSEEDEYVTSLSMRPAPSAPGPAKARTRWARWVGVGAGVVVVGLAAGYLLADHQTEPTKPATSSGPQQYPVVSTVSLAGSQATLSWGTDAAKLPGFQGYLILDVSGDPPRPVNTALLSADTTSLQVGNLRPGRKTCFYVIAVGVTVAPPPQVPPFPCVTVPSAP